MATQLATPNTREHLANVAQLINEAQTLDGNGDELGAYRHYLLCVAQMTQTLSNDIQANQGQGTLPQQQAIQLFKMAKNCLERGEEIYTVAKTEQRPLALFRLASPSPTVSPTLLVPGTSPLLGNGVSPVATQARTAGIPPLLRGATWPKGVVPVKRGLVNVRTARTDRDGSVDGPDSGEQSSVRHLSYMERAKLHNRYMMEQYKAYLKETSSHLPSDAGLSMLRRLEENVGVARIREQTIARRLREKQQLKMQEEAKANRSISLISLSVDEVCDCVTSYEHGKSNISKIKASLNTCGSNLEKVYNIVTEILNLTDHPLPKLLGEGQYSVYMMLQPVVLAIEKAGGLPGLEIRLDNCGLDRKPSGDVSDEGNKTLTDQTLQSSSRTNNHQQEDEATSDLLDLLDDDDDEMLTLSIGSPTLHSNMTSNPCNVTSDLHKTAVGPSRDVLKELKTRLTEIEEVKKERDVGETGNLYHVLDQTFRSKAGVATETETVGQDRAKRDASDGYSKSVNESFNFDSNISYTCFNELNIGEPNYSVPRPQKSNAAFPGGNSSNPQSHSDLSMSQSNGSTPIYDVARAVDDDVTEHLYECLDNGEESNLYEQLDNVFLDLVDQKDLTDGSMFSKVSPSKDEPEELVVFKSLPSLVCAAHLGDEASLIKLSDTASSIVKEAVQKILTILNTLEEVFAKCYPILDSENNREVCSTVLEANFFAPILHPLTLVYRCKNYREEAITARNMCQHVNATPNDFAVRKKFWLIEQTYAPYGEAIDELRRLPSLQGPTPKLDGLVKMSKLLVKCIGDYYEAKGGIDIGVGVDDILPILSYIIIRSGIPQLVTECSIMEEFIRDGYTRGEEGFCLTSFLTALKFVSHMSS